MKKNIINAGKWVLISSAVRSILNFIQLMIIARLYSPQDVGAIIFFSTAIVLLQLIIEAGAGPAIIHFQNSSQNQISILFSINVVIAIVICFNIIIFSKYIANLFHLSEYIIAFKICSFGIFIYSFSVVPKSIYEKNMDFKKLAIFDIISAVITFLSVVVLSLTYAKVELIIASMSFGVFIYVCLIWIFGSFDWKPKMYFKFHEAKNHIRFGAFLLLNNVLNIMSSQIDLILGVISVNKFEYGYYASQKDFSLKLINFINPIFAQISFPTLSKVQNEIQLLRKYYLLGISIIAFINIPMYYFIFNGSELILKFVFGVEWVSYATYLKIFCVMAVSRSIGSYSGSLILASGRSDISFWWNLVVAIISIPLIYLTTSYGLIYVAIMIAGISTLSLFPHWYFILYRLSKIELGEYFSVLAKPLLLSIISSVVSVAILNNMQGNFIALIASCLLFGALYLILSYFFNKQPIILITNSFFNKYNR